MLITYIIIFSLFHLSQGQFSSWYQGCFEYNKEPESKCDILEDHHHFNSSTDHSNCLHINTTSVVSSDHGEHMSYNNIVVKCCEICYHKKFMLAGVHCSGQCLCSNTIDDWTKSINKSCDTRHSTENYLPLSCDQSGSLWSVYSASGPYFTKVSSFVRSRWIIVDVPVVIEVVGELATYVNVTNDVDSIDSSWPFEVSIHLRINNKSHVLSEVAEDSVIVGRLQHVFKMVGNQTIDVVITNGLSLLETTLTLEVIHPGPKDLQVTLMSSPGDLPSCIPKVYNSSLKETHIAVFKDEPFSLEASVAIGNNLTFTFDMENQEKTFIHTSEEEQTQNCSRKDCRIAFQEYVITEEGMYPVRIEVFNQHGQLSREMIVLIVERKLSNLAVYMEGDPPYIVEPHQIIRFFVVMEITNRYGAFLQVEFGDGDIHSSDLEDTNSTSMALNCQQGQMMVAASYGLGCVLKVDFLHSYLHQGNFQPIVTVEQKNQTIISRLNSTIMVIHRLQRAVIQSDRTVAINRPANFTLRFTHRPINITVLWIISDNLNDHMADFTTFGLDLSYIFTEPGIYFIKAIASNVISNDTTITSVFVQIPISNLRFSCGEDVILQTGEEIQCVAEIGKGSDPIFVWTFYEGQHFYPLLVSKNATSVINYTFSFPGMYNISVKAYNNISRSVAYIDHIITVLDPVDCVSIRSWRPTKVSEMAVFQITTCQGSDIQFHFDFGLGRRSYGRPEQAENAYYIGNVFQRHGIYNATVYAFNAVSEMSDTTQVLVQRDIELLEVDIYGESIVGKPTVFYVKNEDQIVIRDDVTFLWEFSDNTRVFSSLPIIAKTFTTAGTYTVSLSAGNLVAAFENVSLKFDTRERRSNELIVVHDVIVVVNQSVEFELQGDNSNWTSIQIRYGRNDIQIIEEENRWSHIFTKAKMYQVEVTIVTGGENYVIDSLVVVQEPISGLVLHGPRVIELERLNRQTYSMEGVWMSLVRDYLWEAHTQTGTNIVYTWYMGFGDHITTTLNKYMKGFESPGVHTVQILAQNEISNMSASLTVFVQYPIIDVSASVKKVALGMMTPLNITVDGGKPFFVSLDFGDGTTLNVSSDEDSYISKTESIGEYVQVPEYLVMLSHRYREVGKYNISIKVSNHVSHDVTSKMAVVGEPITGVQLHTENGSVVHVTRKVIVIATVATGKDLRFEWDFGDRVPPIVESHGNTSVATHIYDVPAEYEVKVKITNPLYEVPVVKTLPYSFLVVDEIEHVSIEETNGRTAAPLEQGFAPFMKTPEVRFEARCVEGSHVSFLFDFGDGDTMMVEGIENPFLNLGFSGVASHHYTREGVYEIKVTAINPLGNVTVNLPTPFYVQIPPRGLELDQRGYYTKLGDNTSFSVNIKQGTNVTFDWKLGDQSDLISDGGYHLKHQYKKAGIFNIVVIAKNKVTSVDIESHVHVQLEIQGVSLQVERLQVDTNTDVQFTAVTFPESAYVKYYDWNVGTQKDPKKQTYKADKSFRYGRSGKYVATVTAVNDVSKAESEPIELHVLARVSVLGIEIFKKVPLVNQLFNFSYSLYSGSDVLFTWSFGDGTPDLVINGSHEYVNHTYTRIAEYKLTLTASNAINNLTVSKNIFVLDRICHPPIVRILAHRLDERHKIYKSESLYVEADLEALQCGNYSAVEFLWVLYNQTTQEEINLKNKHDIIWNRKILILPASLLQIGKYIIEIKVKIKDLIVYSKDEHILEVLSSPLISHIKGGQLREVLREDLVILNGSKSMDPDDPDTKLSFNWTCVIKNKDEPCFNESLSSVIKWNEPVLSVPGSWFRSTNDTQNFVVNLTVAAPGKQVVSTYQIIDIKDKTLPIMIVCPQCEAPSVNSNERIAFQMAYKDYGTMGYLDFEWEVELVEGPVPSDIYAHDNPCVSPDGSSYKSYRFFSNETAENETTTTEVQDIKTISSVTSSPPTQISTESTSVSPHKNPWDSPVEGKGNNGRQTRGNNKIKSSPNHSANNMGGHIPHVSDVSENTNVKSSRHLHQEPIEGDPGEVGSTVGDRRKGFKEDQDKQREVNGFDPLFDKYEKQTKTKELILDRKRILQNFKPLTSTGLNQQSLVINPGSLRQGRTYAVSALVKAKDGSVEGRAITTFKVNKSPSRGACEINPSSGEEIKTVFRVYCREWRDDDLPFQYEVSYNLNVNDTKYVIYRGQNQDIHFTLPAGNPKNDNKVYVYIAILDTYEARTTVCSIDIEVLPRDVDRYADKIAGTVELHHSLEALIYVEAFDRHGQLAAARDKGDDHTVKVLTRYFSSRLNNLPEIVDLEDQAWRQRLQIRKVLLGILSELPIRDKMEAIESLQALIFVTKTLWTPQPLIAKREVWLELSRALDLAVDILRSSFTIYSESLTLNEVLSTLLVQASSNIIKAIAESGQVESSHKWFYQQYLSQSLDVLEQVIKKDLAFHLLGEPPIQKEAEFVSTLATIYKNQKQEVPVLKIDQSKFVLPNNMDYVMSVSSKVNQTDQDKFVLCPGCYKVHMTRFKRNPFSFQNRNSQKVQSEVIALKMYNFDGSPLPINGLPDNNLVTMEIPRLVEEQNSTETSHTLLKSVMNVHQFNTSMDNLLHSLHIRLQLDHVEGDGRLFPVAVLLRYKHPPTPDRHIFLGEIKTDSTDLKVFLPAGYFNVTGEYNIGIVDAGYNFGRPRAGEITSRNYTLRLWWTRCLSWDRKENDWTDFGCWSTGLSTYYVTQCRCNHLTEFGTHFELIQNELMIIPIDDFFALHKNPVTLTLIGLVLCMYACFLVICHKADIHDSKKGGIMYLQDNVISDKQKYEITMETGFRKGAGTTAKISIILHGEEGMSETRELISDDHRPLFERNSRDSFIMTLPDSIGKIWKVQVWHNNFGPSPSWYLSRVIVKDLNTEKTYYFICEKWLAVEEDDGKVEREFMTLEGNLGFRKVFWAKGTQYMSDYHLWISLFTRPCYSQFTRVQRLMCCLTSIVMYMCLNATWFNYKEDKEYRGEFGLLDLSLRNVVIGAVCCAFVIPINQFLALLFRRSKVLNKEDEIPEEEKEEEYPSGKPDERGREEEEDDEETVQPVMTYSILDQSIMNWPSIQDWAQKQWVKRQQSALSIGDTTSNKTDGNQTSSSPTVTQILQKRVIGSETDQASSGFEDSNSTDPRRQFTISSQASSIKNKAPSVSSSGSQKFSANITKDKPRRRIFLPFWCQYVAWFLCTAITLGCAIMTVWFGFRFGSTKGIMWLQSLYFSFLICVFISHPLMILIAVVYTAITYRNDPSILDHYEDGYFGEKAKLEIRRQKKEKSKETCDENEELERGVAARQRSRYLRFARPPQEKQLIEARKKIMKEKKAMSLMRNSVGFGVMLVLLCVMAYGKDISSPFYLNEAIRNELLRTGTPRFVDIRTPDDWYNWSMNSMLDVLYPNSKTGSHFTSNQKEKSILHGSILIIGDVHLRQLRVYDEPCTPELLINLRHLPETCYYGYSSSNKMTASFGINQTFNYQRESSFYRIFGKHGVYDNSGYVIKLNTTRSEALSQLKSLKQDVWIDRKSRAIIVEFTTYSAPTNLFSSVMLLLELPPTGGAFPDHRIMSTYVYRYVTRWDSIILTCELIFIILTVYKLKNELCDMIKLRETYFHNAWNIIEVILGTLSVGYIACYVYRFVLVASTVENLRRTYHEEFVDISLLTVWDEILRAQIGFILFLTVVKSLRLLRYHKLFALFGNVYRRVHREILILLALFIGLLLGFSGLGYALFGTLCWSFKDIGSGLLTMTALMTRNYSHMEIEPSLPYVARLFVFCFCVFATGLLTCYVVAVLSFRFKIYKHKQTDILVMTAREAILFYYEEFLVWTGIKPVIQLEEPENVLPPEFTMAEIEYQVDELFFRINALSGSHSLPEKPTEYLTDSDGVYGVFDDGISSGGSEVHLADEERLEHRVQKIEDNLCSQEPYLAQLLQLDSIGANLLSQEREKQLRSHLELEIFRQLQMQRQDVLPGQQPSAEASKGNTSKNKPSTSWQDKDLNQPRCRKTSDDTKYATGGGQLGVDNFPDESQEGNQQQNIPLRQESSPSSILTISDVQPETSSSSNPESPSEQQINPNRVKKTLEKPGKSTFNRLFDQSDKSGSQSSDSDRGLGSKTAKLSDSKQLKRPDPPPKPTFVHPNVRELPSVDTSRPNLLESPALRQLRTSLNAIERTSSKGDNSGSSFTTESSSGSEDAFHCMQRPIGKRNLRKTKSRGKGKGSGNLTSSFLLDELDIESKEEENDQFDSTNQRGAYKIEDPEPILEQD